MEKQILATKEEKISEKLKGELGVIDKDDHYMDFNDEEEEDLSALDLFKERQKKKEVKEVNHSEISYIKIRKSLYKECKAIKEMTQVNKTKQ